jgi:hypothetical protein
MTAGELMAELNSDPAFVAARAREDSEREALAAEWRRAEAPLVEQLNAAGLEVTSVWDLVNSPSGRRIRSLPILLDHLQRPYPGRVREGIARALAGPQSRFAWDILTRLYRDETDGDAKSGLAVAVSLSADETVIEDLIELVRDKTNGPTRVSFLESLEHLDDARAKSLLLELETDPELEKEIHDILRRRERRERRNELRRPND